MYAAIQQQSYKKIKNCSMPNHIQASEVVIEEIQTASLTKCSAICSESLQCGAVMFDRPSRKCHLIDKDYQVCDENIGVYEVVSYVLFIKFNHLEFSNLLSTNYKKYIIQLFVCSFIKSLSFRFVIFDPN